MKQLLSIVGTFLYCQYKAPQLIMDLPSYRAIKIGKIKKSSASFDIETDSYEKYKESFVPARTIINYEFNGRSGYICLEKDNFYMTGPDLMEEEYLGSAGLGILIFGLPGIILTFPLWVTTGLIIGIMEHISKMDRHSFSVWLRMKNQLDFETQQHFKIALRKRNHGNL